MTGATGTAGTTGSGGGLGARLDVGERSGRSTAWWGMFMTILTEGMLFAILLFVYYYLYSLADSWPLGGIEPPHLQIISIRTVILLASSGTMSFADRAMGKGHINRAALGLAVTAVLGTVFLVGHVEEMLLLVEEFTWATNAYGSLFYVIVNFHALHLMMGLAFLLFAAVALARGRYTAASHDGFRITAMYWHFVDVVWIGVFPTLYLVPHLLGK